MSQTKFNFGDVSYLKVMTAEVVLFNCGLVDLDFVVNLERVQRPWTVEVLKRKGVIKANEKLKLDIRFMTGKRERLRQSFLSISRIF